MSKVENGTLSFNNTIKASYRSENKRMNSAGELGTKNENKSHHIVPDKKPVYNFIKRTFDIIASLACITIGLPIYIVIAIVIMLDDPGNPFFIQERVGKNGKIFKMLKFRTMYRDADKIKGDFKKQNEYKSVHFKIANDPRITRVGNILRKTSLDELPQVINILAGDMSVIGPRPFIKEEQDLLPMDRLGVKPGLSCYWQITDTVNMSYEKQLELDYKYIENRSIRTDIEIIVDTIHSMAGKENY